MHLIACHECDLIHEIPPIGPRGTARCIRCGHILHRAKADSIDRTLAWTFSSMVLYAVAVTFPFLAMKNGPIFQQTALLTGVQKLYEQGESTLSILVLLTCVLVPLLQMIALLYVFIPLKMNVRARYAAQVFRLFQHAKPWSMMEIYLLGILVSIVKLGKMATIVPGLAVIAFAFLVFALAFASSSVDAHMVWEQLGEER